jgi:Uncharacterized protein conserved in bacteria (DUF2252)
MEQRSHPGQTSRVGTTHAAASTFAKEVRVKRVSKREGRAAEEMVAKAQTRDSTRVFARRADEVDGELRIVADPPVIVPIEDLIQPGSAWEDPAPLVKKLLASYRRTLGRQHHPLEEFRYVHAAYKMVGVGSVGTRCYIMLMLGRDHNDPLFLQIKEAQASVIGLVVGVPLGLALGQFAWREFATNFGVVPVPVLPPLPLAVLAGAVLAVANALALGPRRAGRAVPPGPLLRTE